MQALFLRFQTKKLTALAGHMPYFLSRRKKPRIGWTAMSRLLALLKKIRYCIRVQELHRILCLDVKGTIY